MKINSLFISSVKPQAGSLIVCMGMMQMLKTRFEKVAFFRPFIETKDKVDSDIDFMIKYFNLNIKYEDSYAYSVDEAEELVSDNKLQELISSIMSKFKQLEKNYDFVVCEGLSQEVFSQNIGIDLNILVSKNLGTPLLSVLNAKNKTTKEIVEEYKIEKANLKKSACKHFSSFINRVEPNLHVELQKKLSKEKSCFILDEIAELDEVSVNEILQEVDCKKLFGNDSDLSRSIKRQKVAAMNLENYLSRMKDGDFVIVPGDRADIIVGLLAAFFSKNHAMVSGIMLTGGVKPSKQILDLFKGVNEEFVVPILLSEKDTFSTALAVSKVKAKIHPNSERKIALALGLFDANVDLESLSAKFLSLKSDITTPLMFEYSLFEKARVNRKHIVLPESLDERILRATEILLRRDVVDITLLGSVEDIKFKAISLDLDISKANIIEPRKSKLKEKYTKEFYNLRKAKGLSLLAAQDAMAHSTYFATMMVQMGDADGMVSGAIHTTQDTIRPALQIIKTKPNISLVSSLFFMCMDTKVLVYADCAVNQDPSADELAQIAISSADTASGFGIEAKIAMLSYSTGDSGKGNEVQKVKDATKIVKELRPELLIEGPIQYDAAVEPSVAAKKLPNSKVAGEATILIFPDLNTGNNTYKAVQRSSGAVAIGPVLQGLKKPVNDLSRGCLVADIVNTVAITAIQAGINS